MRPPRKIKEEEIRSFSSYVSNYLHNESGATAIEYALLAALIGVSIVVGAAAMTGSINSMFKDIDSELVIALDSSEDP